jgi:hypothetical protein
VQVGQPSRRILLGAAGILAQDVDKSQARRAPSSGHRRRSTHTLARPDDPFICVPWRLSDDGEDWEGLVRRLAGMRFGEIVADPELLGRAVRELASR